MYGKTNQCEKTKPQLSTVCGLLMNPGLISDCSLSKQSTFLKDINMFMKSVVVKMHFCNCSPTVNHLWDAAHDGLYLFIDTSFCE